MTGVAIQVPASIDDVRESLAAAGIEAVFDCAHASEARLGVRVPTSQRDHALQVVVAALRRSGQRVCFDTCGGVRRVFAFPPASGRGLHVELHDQPGIPRLPARTAPHFALVGPDGVGKSTVLRLIRERISAEAPFFRVSVNQWRPGLLPSLARLAGKPDSGDGPSDFRPRRTPGNLHFFRLGYYAADFIAGPRWKHRESSEPRLIIYDRCALDMRVHPYRFALRSRTGTNLLWKIIPKPASIILLHDDGARIAARKDDLSLEEIQEQLAFWLGLVKHGEVTSVVEVNDDPEEIANRVFQILVDQFLACHEQTLPANPRHTLDQLEETPDGARYAMLPKAANARFLISLEGRSASAAGLGLYNAQKPIARFAKSALGLALRFNPARRLWPSAIRLNTQDLESRFRDLLGGEIRLAFSAGSGRERRRLILQVASPGGEVLAYAKAGFDPSSQAAIRNEEEILRSLDAAGFPETEVPRVLGSFAWQGAWVLAQTPAPRRARKTRHHFSECHVEFLTRLRRAFPGTAPAEWSVPDAAAQLKRLGFPYYAELTEWAGQAIPADLPGTMVHGDFTPWNMTLSNERLFVFDWECASPAGPAAWDAFHFCVASSVELRGASAAGIFADIMGPSHTHRMLIRYFDACSIDARLFRPLFLRYLADALAASIVASPAGADEKEEMMRRTWAGLMVLLRYDTGGAE